MTPVHMTRQELRATLRARRTVVKPDTRRPGLRIAALYCLAELDRRLRCEIRAGARSRKVAA